MIRIRCQRCGEVIEDAFVNREEHIAFCRRCGDFTYISEGVPLPPLIPLRVLLAHPPPNVRTKSLTDGTRVFTIRPHDRARQFRNIIVAVVFGLLSLLGVFVMMMLPSLEWTVISYETIYNIAQYGVAFLAVLAFFCLCLAIPFYLNRAMESMRLWLSPTKFTCLSYCFGFIPMGYWRLPRDDRADVRVHFLPDYLPSDEEGFPIAPFTDAEVVWHQMGRKDVKILQSKNLIMVQYVRAILLDWLGKLKEKPPFRCWECGASLAFDDVDVKNRMIVHCPSCGTDTTIHVADICRLSTEVLRNPPPRGVKVVTESELMPDEWAGLSYRGWRVCWWWKGLFLLCFFLVCWFMLNWIPYFVGVAASEWLSLRGALIVGPTLLGVFLWAMTIYRCRCEIRIVGNRVICTFYARFRTQTREVSLEGQSFASRSDDGFGITLYTNCGQNSERMDILVDCFPSSFCTWASAWLNSQLEKCMPRG